MYNGLQAKTKALRASKPAVSVSEAEGFELQPTDSTSEKQKTDSVTPIREQAAALRNEWDAWKVEAIINA
jgi:hypothetical protein